MGKGIFGLATLLTRFAEELRRVVRMWPCYVPHVRDCAGLVPYAGEVGSGLNFWVGLGL